MRFSELIPLTAAVINLLLTIFVLSKNLRAVVNRVYFLWGTSLTVWNVGTFFMFRVGQNNEASALFWAHFLQFGVIFLPVSLAHLCLLVGQIQMRRTVRLFYVLHAGLALMNFTPYFIRGVNNLGYAWYCDAGPGFWLFTLTYSFPVFTVALLARKRSRLPPLHRTRITYMMIAVSTLIVFGMNDTLPILGITHYPLIGTKVFPFGSLAAIFYGVIVGYSVLQHHLLGVHVVMGRASAHVVRLMFLLAIALALMFTVSLVAPAGQFPEFAFFAAMGVFAVSAIIASIIFPRIFGHGEDEMVRRILGDRFEYHDRISGFTQSLPHFNQMSPLMDSLEELLVKTVRVRSYQVILLDEKTRQFVTVRSQPPGAATPDLHVDSPIFEFFRTAQADYLPFNLAYSMPGQTNLEESARAQFAALNPEFCFPMAAGGEPFGLLLIGDKTSGEPYTRHDLMLLGDLAQKLSLTVYQIRLKSQILLAEEMELMGRMSRGLAHDLNNLVTPVSTYLQLIEEQHGKSDGLDDLLPVALRNIQTIRAYIREALFFSNTRSLHVARIRLDRPIRTAAALAETKFKPKDIHITLDLAEDAEIEVDEVLIQRVVDNLLSNAADASPAGSAIHVRMAPLARTEARRDWYRVEVIDQGEGISKDNLKRIFTPYFTTKDKGDKNRGFGLGLAICRKIVHLHGGNLNVISEERKGTTIQLDLPSLQITKTAPAAEAVLT